ncbi:DUF4767 domain-containing protein [Vagococcus fluvialis]|uniref:DUF4767 domain-containing protein n=1 Tax=Vagococcus fluvialis TaxID=2738 RepID=A0A7X6D7U4_9ENTE|nr:DUF4767 domain-containing protein [Vagococcus fluvialis]NKC67354.1 DUF4767 domain-containing protein [Vagococcus fluvialis]
MKKKLLTCVILCSLLLVGCGRKDSKLDTKPTAEKEEIKKSVDLKNDSKSLWNKEKEIELEEYMVMWGNNNYQKLSLYSLEDSVNWYEVDVPKEILKKDGEIKASIGADELNMVWSEDGKIKEGADRALVAVFSNAENQPDNNYLYIFTVLPDGKGEVLMSSQSAGNEITSFIYFRPVEDENISEKFSYILGEVNGEEGTGFELNEEKINIFVDADIKPLGDFDEFDQSFLKGISSGKEDESALKYYIVHDGNFVYTAYYSRDTSNFNGNTTYAFNAPNEVVIKDVFTGKTVQKYDSEEILKIYEKNEKEIEAEKIKEVKNKKITYDGEVLSEIPVLYQGKWVVSEEKYKYIFEIGESDFKFTINDDVFPLDKPRRSGNSIVFDTDISFGERGHADSISFDLDNSGNGIVTINFRDGYTNIKEAVISSLK